MCSLAVITVNPHIRDLFRLIQSEAWPAIMEKYLGMDSGSYSTYRGGRKNLLWILAHSTVVNFWNQKPSDAALESSRWEELSYRFSFYIFFDWGFLLRKNHLAVDGKKRFALQFLVPSLKKYEKKHEPFLMMVITLIFTPKRKSLVFSRSAAVWQRAHG